MDEIPEYIENLKRELNHRNDKLLDEKLKYEYLDHKYKLVGSLNILLFIFSCALFYIAFRK